MTARNGPTAHAFALAVATLFALGAGQARATFVDTLDNTNHFTNVDIAGVTATANVAPSGTVTLTRTVSGGDPGIDWRPNGTGFLSINELQLLEIVPHAIGGTNGASYIVNILFFNNAHAFVDERNWGTFNTTDTQTLNVLDFRIAQGVSAAAAEYYVRFRLVPSTFDEGSEPSFTFEQISAVPEPASLLMVGGGLALIAARRRRQNRSA